MRLDSFAIWLWLEADGTLDKLLRKIARTDVLIVDDWALNPLAETERRDFYEICEDRYDNRSTILTSQLPVAHWHEQIGDPTTADSILDRLVDNAYRIDLEGASMRRHRHRIMSQTPQLKVKAGWFAAGAPLLKADRSTGAPPAS